VDRRGPGLGAPAPLVLETGNGRTMRIGIALLGAGGMAATFFLVLPILPST
jgi:hypothetical protein